MEFQGKKQSGRVGLMLMLSALPGILEVPAWAGAPVSDAFNATSLNTSLWTFVNPVGDGTYSLSGTNLLISVPAGVNHDVWATGDNGARIMQSITDADFEVAVKMDTPVTAGSQMEGIIVEQSATQFLRFDLRRDSVSPRLFAASISGTTGTFRIDFALPGVTAPFWLKVKRAGNTWTESYSTDGTTYITGGSFSYALTATKIGLFAGNYGNPPSAAPALTASFDYFLNTAAGTAPDLTVGKTHSGTFVQTGTGSYSVTVSNVGGAPTTQPVSIADTLPEGLEPATASGTGWTCGISSQTVSCTRSDALAVASSYPPVAVSVSISASAPSSVTNTVTVAGGGETNTANDSASDPTTIQPAGQPPVIGNISAAVTSASATITWTTDIASTSQVDYGATTGYGSTVSDPTLVTSHSLNLTGLGCEVTYQYKVTSTSSTGFSASSSNQTFTTAACSTSGVPVSDNFDAPALNTSLWTFVNPVGDGILTFNGSEAQLTVPQGTNHDVWTAGNRSARIMQTMPNTDFEVVVRFNSIPMFAYQIQGLIVEQDSSNYIRFDSHYDGTSIRLYCASFASGTPITRLDTPVMSSSYGPPFFLRVKRTGNTWTESYSTDGLNYTVGTTFSLTLSVARIGPFAGNASNGTNLPAFTASVDYFFNTASPVANNDGQPPFDRFVIDNNPPKTTLLKTLADIDGDGRLDAVIGFGNAPGQSTGHGLAWYQYPHSGNPADLWNKYTILASGLMYEDSAAYDVNQDGAIDIIASVVSAK